MTLTLILTLILTLWSKCTSQGRLMFPFLSFFSPPHQHCETQSKSKPYNPGPDPNLALTLALIKSCFPDQPTRSLPPLCDPMLGPYIPSQEQWNPTSTVLHYSTALV
ncbi:unnamed protein product, partial [Discosporangium mesarthrocarpum]